MTYYEYLEELAQHTDTVLERQEAVGHSEQKRNFMEYRSFVEDLAGKHEEGSYSATWTVQIGTGVDRDETLRVLEDEADRSVGELIEALDEHGFMPLVFTEEYNAGTYTTISEPDEGEDVWYDFELRYGRYNGDEGRLVKKTPMKRMLIGLDEDDDLEYF